ncbi:MAG: hypothetical protein GY953_06655 [bacterium]|nr:hypothetical protein [bacterium]
MEENWTGAQGMRGRSFNIYSPLDRKWHQTWVDTNGLLLKLSGTFTGTEMTPAGDGGFRDGTARHQIRWSKLPDGRVRQHWRVSTDEGKIWSDLFVGFYSLKK